CGRRRAHLRLQHLRCRAGRRLSVPVRRQRLPRDIVFRRGDCPSQAYFAAPEPSPGQAATPPRRTGPQGGVSLQPARDAPAFAHCLTRLAYNRYRTSFLVYRGLPWLAPSPPSPAYSLLTMSAASLTVWSSSSIKTGLMRQLFTLARKR